MPKEGQWTLCTPWATVVSGSWWFSALSNISIEDDQKYLKNAKDFGLNLLITLLVAAGVNAGAREIRKGAEEYSKNKFANLGQQTKFGHEPMKFPVVFDAVSWNFSSQHVEFEFLGPMVSKIEKNYKKLINQKKKNIEKMCRNCSTWSISRSWKYCIV